MISVVNAVLKTKKTVSKIAEKSFSPYSFEKRDYIAKRF